MPVDGAPAGRALHGTAVAIGGRALVITGRSGAGKSRLAAALVAASTPRRRIQLVGDDRVLLVPSARGLEVRPHPRIAGFIERRGLGLVAMAWCPHAVVRGFAVLGEDAAPDMVPWQNRATIRLVDTGERDRAETVLDWWTRLDMEATHASGTTAAPRLSDDEDWNW